jgi:hypothetical protein
MFVVCADYLDQRKITELPFLTIEKGTLWLGPRSVSGRLEPLLSALPYIGLVLTILHPTIASLYGPPFSFYYAAVTVALLLPVCRTIVIVPAIAIVVTCAMISIFHWSVNSLATIIAAYAIFWLIMYETRRFQIIFLWVSTIAGIVALLQFLFASDALNFHATAVSNNRFLDQYRPTSIFSSQVFYLQFLMLSLPLFLIINETRAWIWALFGVAAAITGATAGILYAGFALLISADRRGLGSVFGFVAAMIVMFICYPERVYYNFSLPDIRTSVMQRVSPQTVESNIVIPDKVQKPQVPAVAVGGAMLSVGHPTLAIVIESIAVAGLLFATMVALMVPVPFLRLLSFVAALCPLVVGQLLHLTIGSLYFSLYLAVFAALEWKFIQMYAFRNVADT